MPRFVLVNIINESKTQKHDSWCQVGTIMGNQLYVAALLLLTSRPSRSDTLKLKCSAKMAAALCNLLSSKRVEPNPKWPPEPWWEIGCSQPSAPSNHQSVVPLISRVLPSPVACLVGVVLSFQHHDYW